MSSAIFLFTGWSVLEIITVIGVPAFLSFVFQWIFVKKMTKAEAKKEKKKDNACAIEAGVTSLLRDRLRRNYLVFKGKGHIDMADKENYHALYVSYHNLGGNGMVDEMYEQIMDLPLTIETEHQIDDHHKEEHK